MGYIQRKTLQSKKKKKKDITFLVPQRKSQIRRFLLCRDFHILRHMGMARIKGCGRGTPPPPKPPPQNF